MQLSIAFRSGSSARSEGLAYGLAPRRHASPTLESPGFHPTAGEDLDISACGRSAPPKPLLPLHFFNKLRHQVWSEGVFYFFTSTSSTIVPSFSQTTSPIRIPFYIECLSPSTSRQNVFPSCSSCFDDSRTHRVRRCRAPVHGSLQVRLTK